ncbi:para-nitrobenzyl esterase [Paraburkholderia sp. RAU6.4a]|uniref:carboxylesterase/lipase family protein n=1 Tax=Paraburkholderia sp. RAU6.4a TaxID=2991067 RepID=UPI003D1D1586
MAERVSLINSSASEGLLALEDQVPSSFIIEVEVSSIQSKNPGYQMLSKLLSHNQWTKFLIFVFGLALWVTTSTATAGLSGLENNFDFVSVGTETGAVRGKLSNDGAVEVFKGIPYAAPPVGELRWKAPRPPLPWSGIRDAFDAGSPCPQTGRLASVNEDCLYLNVWAPHHRPQHDLPVMVFIHGGGQRVSAANEYNADWLVTRGAPVVYVSMNYRLNIFAFFAHKALTAEGRQLGSGNYATLDQQQALRWVRANIAKFGGDPENITIFGESGGAQAVCVLLASPPARGLFQKAIIESGPCQWQFFPSLTAAEERGTDTAAQLGCTEANPLPCLRALPAQVILSKERGATSDTSGAQPAWGGGAFPIPIREAIASGRFNQVPLIQGSNRDEAMFDLALRYDGKGKSITPAQYPTILEQYFGQSRVAAIQQQYPLADYPTPMRALIAVLSDSGMVTNDRIGLCNLHLASQLASPHVQLYTYEFADGTAPYPAPIFDAPGNQIGAAHTKELSYLFHQTELTPAQRKISDAMIGYWTNFATKGNPNGKNLPIWPAYKPDQQSVMKFDTTSVNADTDFYARHRCAFWEEQGYGLLSGPYPTPTASGPDYR